jgi:hypothetical protein
MAKTEIICEGPASEDELIDVYATEFKVSIELVREAFAKYSTFSAIRSYLDTLN